MAPAISRHTFTSNGHTTSYLTAVPQLRPLLIFVHGWPGIAETWKHQLEVFASLGFYTVAVDCRGYGQSSVPKTRSDYKLEKLVEDVLALLSYLERDDAVWIGHDWGSVIVWGLAAHHPKICRAVVNLAVPYRTLECGLETLISLVNRDIHPADQYPNGQWDYQASYERIGDRVTQQYENDVANGLKACYSKAIPAIYGKPSPRHATVTRDGGFFGGADSAPDALLASSVFGDDPELMSSFSRSD